MGDKAFITPAVLKWAHESARMTEQQAAAKAGVSVQKIQEWEQGIDRPTIRQAKLLAVAFRRPFALFMLPKPPQDFTLLRDFRRKNAVPFTTASVFIFRELQEKQAWLHEWLEEEGQTSLPFVGRFSIKDKPFVVAANILEELDLHPPYYSQPIKEWMTKAEAKGIFISRTSYIHSRLLLDSDEFQGFAVADPIAPLIFINTEDWHASQLFTLVHEIAHIWIAQSGISNEIKPGDMLGGDLDPVEGFCNQVAAIALMPKDYMESLPLSVFASSEEVYRQAHRCGVSSIALLIRARSLDLINQSKYNQLKAEADQAFLNYQEKEALKKSSRKPEEGGPNPHRILTNKNGLLFSRLVLDAFRGGFIQPTQASTLLGTSIKNFTKLETFAYP